MFSRTNYANPFQSFGFGAPQQAFGAAFGGINPMVPQMMNPYSNIPLAALTGVGAGSAPWGTPFSHAHNPYLPQGLNQQFGLAAAQFGLPLNLVGNPYAQQALGNPYAQQVLGNPYAQQALGNPYAQQAYGYTPIGYTPYGYPGVQLGFGGLGVNGQGFNGLVPSLFTAPTLGVDPLIASAISQQTLALPQSPLPIRPLINQYQSDPLQVAAINQAAVPYQIGGLFGGPLGQSIDPSSILAQASLGQQTLNPQIGTPWTVHPGNPFWATQQIPAVQTGYQACP
jgi:hypothetical protein